MNYESLFQYISNIFLPYLVEKKIKLPVILVLNGHRSHNSLQLSKFCSGSGITIITLPSNYTHILQPLEVAFFKPMKGSWQRELDKFKRDEGKRHGCFPCDKRGNTVTTIVQCQIQYDC